MLSEKAAEGLVLSSGAHLSVHWLLGFQSAIGCETMLFKILQLILSWQTKHMYEVLSESSSKHLQSDPGYGSRIYSRALPGH